jgi:hypothetical protein
MHHGAPGEIQDPQGAQPAALAPDPVARGSYTRVIQMRLNSRNDLKRTRSTKAPVIRAGVITANIIWKAAKSPWGMVLP